MTERISVVPFRRSVFQVALLMAATGGLYVLVWAYFVRRACASILEQEDQPLWKSVALIVPIFNFFLMFDLGKKIQGVQWRADPSRVDGSLPWVGISFFVFLVLGKVEGNAGFLGVFNFVPIALMQHRFSRAQIALLGEAAVPTGFHWLEWVVVAVGGALWAFFLYVIVSPAFGAESAPGQRAWSLACTAVAVAALALLGVISRRAIAEGVAMYENPSPDRIAPYA